MNYICALEMTNICKEFPGVKALDNVCLNIKKGEVLCLLGENGAGKSTLLKILSGAYRRDAGVIVLDGKQVVIRNPEDAIKEGIAVIYQELNDIGNLSVAENIYLERQPTSKITRRINWNRMYSDAKKIFDHMGVDIDPRKTMDELSVAEKQIVEIARAVSNDMKVLVTDEPTSALNDTEVRKLFEIINELKNKGVAIIFISHRLDEVMEISDRVLVLRDGKAVGLLDTDKTTKQELVSLMVGRTMTELFPKRRHDLGETILEVEHLSSTNVKDIDFQLHKGEILGFFGLMGSGIVDVGYLLFGKGKKDEHTQIRYKGEVIRINRPEDAIAHRIGFVPPDRKQEGLVQGMNLEENISLSGINLQKGKLRLNHKKNAASTQKWIEQFKIKTPSAKTEVRSLSGGNQQKVILGKWMDIEPEILILEEPTRGIDVGAKQEIYSFMENYCRNGGAIILITSEIRDILELSDNIMIMHDGRLTGSLNHKEANQQLLLEFAMGGV